MKLQSPSEYSSCDWMQWFQCHSHCWKHSLQSSTKMLWGLPAIVVEPLQHQQHASLSAKNKMMVVSHLPLARSRPLWLLCSQGWIRIWNRGVVLMLHRFNENRWRPLTAFLMKILDNVPSSGSSTGIAACNHRGSALKGTKVSNLYDHFKQFF